MKRGRVAAAQPGTGREGVKKGEAEHPGGKAALELVGKAVGTRHGVRPGLGSRDRGCRAGAQQCQGSGLQTGLVLGSGSSVTLRWQPAR